MKNKTPYNFGGLPSKYSNYKDSKIVILPVPFDKTSTWLKGSAKGPRAIINASRNMELYDIETDSEVCRKGIHTLKKITAETSKGMISRAYRDAKDLLNDGKFIVTLGGEHTVSIGPIQAYSELFNNISILHLDAHSDMRDTYEGSKYSHACVMARVREITDNTVSAGIRSMDSSEQNKIDKSRTFYASDIHQGKAWVNSIVRMLSENVYITIDLDVFDPSIMPSTGTPEPGGPGWYDIIRLLENVSRKRKVIGFDIVELCPSENKAPDFLSAKLIYRLLSFIYRTK